MIPLTDNKVKIELVLSLGTGFMKRFKQCKTLQMMMQLLLLRAASAAPAR